MVVCCDQKVNLVLLSDHGVLAVLALGKGGGSALWEYSRVAGWSVPRRCRQAGCVQRGWWVLGVGSEC